MFLKHLKSVSSSSFALWFHNLASSFNDEWELIEITLEENDYFY